MSFVLGEWRAGKVRPVPGNPPHGRPVSRVISCPLWSICDDSCDTTRFPQLQRTYRARGMRFQGMAESFTPMWFKSKSKTKPELGPTTSRRSAPTQVEERDGRTAPFSSFAMSSGRLILDRVGRHQSPSPLRRHPQNKSLVFRLARNYHRTAGSVLTVCVSRGDKRRVPRWSHRRRQ